MSKKLTLEEFITKAKIIHGNKYDYSKVIYNGCSCNVCIICPIHGEFWQKPVKHLQGHGCIFCSHAFKITKNELITRSIEKYNNKYDFSKIEEFKNNKSYISVICHKKDKNGIEHGIFKTRIDKFLQGCGCPKCGGTKLKTSEEFIQESKKLYGNKYDYFKVNYKNNYTCVEIKCNHCNKIFRKRPHDFLQGQECPFCKNYKMEKDVAQCLEKKGIFYIKQFSFLENKKRHYDIFIPSLQLIIECQGEQHFKPTSFSSNQSQNEIESNFIKQINRDIEVYELAVKNNINIIYFTNPYSFRNKEKIKIDLNINFYKDKKLFTNLKKLLNYIEKIKNNG